MLDPSLDKALDLAFSLASRGEQLLSSSLTGVKPEVIVACAAGLITFTFSLKLVSALANRREHCEQTADWPSQISGPNEIPEARTAEQLQTRFRRESFEPSGRAGIADPACDPVQRSSEPRRTAQLELTDQLRQQLQMRFWGESFELSRTAGIADPAYDPVQRSSEPRRTADIAEQANSCLHQYSDRVGRKGLSDFLYRLVGCYPWQCAECFRRFYRHQRY